MVDIKVMQCMPLGPPRVGKTCLKKRLLNEDFSMKHSPSTPIVGEKQTIVIESPAILTLEAESKNWKHIPWESEVLHLIHKFKNSPQSLFNSLKSSNPQKNWILLTLAISTVMLISTLCNYQWILCLFSLLSSISALTPKFYASSVLIFVMYLTQLSIIIASYGVYEKYQAWTAIALMLFTMLQDTILSFVDSYRYRLTTVIVSWAVWFSSVTALIYLGYLESDITFRFGLFILCIENSRSMVFGNNEIASQLYSVTFILQMYYDIYKEFDYTEKYMYKFVVELIQFIKCTLAISILQFDSKGLRRFLQFFWCVLLIFTQGFKVYFENVSMMAMLTDVYTMFVFISLYDSKRVVIKNDHDSNTDHHDIVKKAVTIENNISKISEFSENNLDGSLKIYFTDSGGQPEFQEVLPALLSGPTVFFLVFNLLKPFDANYEVDYVDSNCSQFKPYRTQYTVMDSLLQCLASISCLGEFSKTSGKKNLGIRPKVFFIGTHKDLVEDAIISKMEKELESAIKKTAWYKKNMIEFASTEHLIFSVNNSDKTDSSFDQVRDAIQKLSQSGTGYKIKIPARWLGLELKLRSHNENVIHFSECKKIAAECSITKTKDVEKALWFLHNKVGSIRHYQQIPELKNIVITKPQLLFTIVTDLLVSTFPCATRKVNSAFQDEGIFTRDEVQKIGKIDKTGLTVTQVIALLCYLHILAPLKTDRRGNTEYFLPCVLSHAPKQMEEIQSKDNIILPALLIGFKCGYTPKGVFGALISYLLQNTHAGVKWVLDKKRIFRDQATFVIGNTGYSLIITNLTKYLQLELCEPQSSEGLDSNKYSSNMIRSCFSNGLGVVCKRLNYTCETEPLFGFYCTCSTSERQHPSYMSKKNDSITQCSEYPSKSSVVNDEQKK